MAKHPTPILPKHWFSFHRERPATIRVSPLVVETAALDVADVYARLRTRASGLRKGEARARLARSGPNVLARDRRPGFGVLLWRAVRNPLVILLAVLATTALATGDARAAAMMLSMI